MRVRSIGIGGREPMEPSLIFGKPGRTLTHFRVNHFQDSEHRTGRVRVSRDMLPALVKPGLVLGLVLVGQ